MEVARRVGRTGRVTGIDPGAEQIARARAKAVRRNAPGRVPGRSDRATPFRRSNL